MDKPHTDYRGAGIEAAGILTQALIGNVRNYHYDVQTALHLM